MRIQLKIALMFTVVTTITMIFITLFIYYFASRNAFKDFQTRLQVRATVAARALMVNPSDTHILDSVDYDLLERLPSQKEYAFDLKDGKPFDVPADLNVPLSFFSEAIESGYSAYQKNQHYYAAVYNGKIQRKLVVVSAVNIYGQQYLDNLKRIKVIGLLIKITLVFSIGFYFSNRMLEPVRQITREAREISAISLNRRLHELNTNDELAELTNTFNNMLDRLETAFESQNNFVSNASHELSTPLTAIISESEWALNRDRSNDDYKASLATILNQAERLKHITKSLLQLAQSGFDGSKQVMKPVRIDELLLEAKNTVDELYPGNKIAFDFSLMPENHELLQVNGNAALLQLAFGNILINACKYSDNQLVKVAIGATDTRIILAVKDAGIGIPAEDLPYIFDPFFRASNTRKFKGYGIGLPLTRNILRIHQGEIIVTSTQGEGTLIEMSLPLLHPQS
jgi:signal transduction histidine kinase